jgi:hypothetical protein
MDGALFEVAYIGAWFALPVEDASVFCKEMDLYAGYNFQLSKLVTLDVGVTRYVYDQFVTGFLDKDNSTEGKLGLCFNTLLSPNLYYYNDFNLKVQNLEAKVSHSFELTGQLSLDLGANLGHCWGEGDFTSFTYWGAKFDLSYALCKSASVSIGPRYAGSTEKYVYGNYDDMAWRHQAVWWAVGLAASY